MTDLPSFSAIIGPGREVLLPTDVRESVDRAPGWPIDGRRRLQYVTPWREVTD